MSWRRLMLTVVLMPLVASSGLPHLACQCSTGEIRLHCPKLYAEMLRFTNAAVGDSKVGSCCRRAGRTAVQTGMTRSCCCASEKRQESRESFCCPTDCRCSSILVSDSGLVTKSRLDGRVVSSQIDFDLSADLVIRLPRCTQVDAKAVDTGPPRPTDPLVLFERMLVAWIRTSVSMITFGFALYKFFFYLHEDKPITHREQIFGARTYGICMIGIGVLSLVLAIFQHRAQLKQLKEMGAIYPQAPCSLSMLIASLVAGLGVIAFALAMFRF